MVTRHCLRCGDAERLDEPFIDGLCAPCLRAAPADRSAQGHPAKSGRLAGVVCPYCSAVIPTLDMKLEGQKVACRKCGSLVKMPGRKFHVAGFVGGIIVMLFGLFVLFVSLGGFRLFR